MPSFPRRDHRLREVAMRARQQPRGRRTLVGIGIVAMTLGCGPASPTGDHAAAPSSAAAPASGGPAAAGPASSPPLLQKLHGSYSGIQMTQSPAWLALEGGYFQEQGLDAHLTLITSGATLLAALRNGEVDL